MPEENLEANIEENLIWEGMTPQDQGFDMLAFPLIERAERDIHEYHIYSDANNFTSVMADTAVDAINKSGIENPFMVSHTHCRIPTRIHSDKLLLKK
tara:strand:- start:1708 stop:1998 length:291 start_codon:yes stop_codon:yes gene_type:complete